MDWLRKTFFQITDKVPNLNSKNSGAYAQCESINHCEWSPKIWGGGKHAKENW